MAGGETAYLYAEAGEVSALGFWPGFVLGVIITLSVCGYFYLKIQARHEAQIYRLEAKLKPAPYFVEDIVPNRKGKM